MYLKRLRIENFKSFGKVEFNFNLDLNVLTGANNSGKTTGLEAIALWAECFRKRIWQAGQAKRGIKKGEYRLDYPLHIDIDSVRRPNFEDIFHDLDSKEDIALDMLLAGEDEELEIGFTVRSARGGNDIVELRNREDFSHPRFNEFFERFPNPVGVVYASPVAAVLSREEFETLPKVRALVDSRQSLRVLRNRLYELQKNGVLYQSFLRTIGHILLDDESSVELTIQGNETRDVEVKVLARIGAKDVPKDISLLGSGAL